MLLHYIGWRVRRVVLCEPLKRKRKQHRRTQRAIKLNSCIDAMFLLTLSVVFFWIAAGTAMVPDTSPTVRVRNGTYVGLHSSTYHQDLFLGMPYAQQPIGNLRFTTPQPLNESWDGVRQAKRYSDICVGYGVCLESMCNITTCTLTL